MAGKPSWRIAAWVFVASQGVFLGLTSGRARTTDEHSMHFMAESLWRESSLAVPQMVANQRFYGRYGLDGRPYSPYGPGQPVLAAPYYALGTLLEGSTPIARLLGRQAGTTLFSSTATAACLAVFFLLGVELGLPTLPHLITALLLGGTTLLGSYATFAFSEPLLALCATTALLGLARALRLGSSAGLWLAAAAAGYAFVTKFTFGTLLFASLVGGYLWERRGRPRSRDLIALGLPFTLGVVAYAAHNTVRFGHPLVVGYPETAEAGRELLAFSMPMWLGLYGILLSPGKSLVLFAPLLLVAPLGFPALFRRRSGIAVASLSLALTTLLLYSRYTAWEGGYCFGPRYFVPVLPALLIPLALVLGRARPVKVAVTTLALIGALVQCLGVSTSFLEDQAGTGRYYDERYVYRFDYSLAGQSDLFWRYWSAALTRSEEPQRLGIGLAFWFVQLSRAGLPAHALRLWGLIALLAAMGGGLGLAREVRRLTPSTPPPEP